MQSPVAPEMDSRKAEKNVDAGAPTAAADALMRKNFGTASHSSYWSCTIPSLSDNLFLFKNLLGAQTGQKSLPASNVRSQVCNDQMYIQHYKPHCWLSATSGQLRIAGYMYKGRKILYLRGILHSVPLPVAGTNPRTLHMAHNQKLAVLSTSKQFQRLDVFRSC